MAIFTEILSLLCPNTTRKVTLRITFFPFVRSYDSPLLSNPTPFKGCENCFEENLPWKLLLPPEELSGVILIISQGGHWKHPEIQELLVSIESAPSMCVLIAVAYRLKPPKQLRCSALWRRGT